MRTTLLIAFALCLAAISTIDGQASPSPAVSPTCNLAARRFDQYLSDGTAGGFTAPRWEHHAIHIGLSAGITLGVHRAFHLSAIPSAVIGAIAIGVVPHARGLLAHRYPLNRGDVIGDAVLASEPLIATMGFGNKATWQSRTLSILANVASYAAVCTYLSP